MKRHYEKRKHWTQEQLKILVDNYPESTRKEMEELLCGVFVGRAIHDKAKNIGLRKSETYKSKYNILSNGKFLSGGIPWNKGVNYQAGGRSIETRFKPGLVPKNRSDVGTKRIDSEGYVYIKIEEGKHKFRLLHREVWKEHHGEYPPKNMILVFRDGNKQNCDIKNLECITRKELMSRNSVQNYPEEIKGLIRLRAVITRKINGR